MNTINIPGFTAEDSLYRTSGRYQRTSSTHRVELNASLVQPSAAIYVGGRFVCYGEVTDQGFINCYPLGGGDGGGDDGRERAACLRQCRPSCSRQPIAERADCLRDCIESC